MMMRRLVFALALPLLAFAPGNLAQSPPLVMPLAVPTLVPPAPEPDPLDALQTESAVADIIRGNTLRAGALYNEPPYSEYTLQGELRGFDIALLRLIAQRWGSEIEFAQVTRRNALDQLNRGAVHLVASAFRHYRHHADRIEFSQTYRQGRQAALVNAGSDISALADLAGRPVGFVIGTRSETALNHWITRSGMPIERRPFVNLDRAFAALGRGDIAALVSAEQNLLRVSRDFADAFRPLEEAVALEPHAFALRRQDAPLRHLLDRTLQALARDGELQALFREYFPDETLPPDLIPLWDGIGDDISPAQFPRQIAYPTTYRVPRVLSGGVLRVGGLADGAGENSVAERQLAQLNRALAEEIAGRWGASAQFTPSSGQQALDLLRADAIDIAVGVKPDWAISATVDFSAPYLLHGDRLMTPKPSQIAGFYDLRGRIVGLLMTDETAQDRAQAWADSINVSLRFFRTTERGAAQTLLDFRNAHAIYADSLALIPHLEANPNRLRLTDRWYSRATYTFALPPNDPDFRNLVNYTLQELIRDGALYRLTAPLLVSDTLPGFEIAPGSSVVAGINLARS